MGCGNSQQAGSPQPVKRDTNHRKHSNDSGRKHTPPPRDPTPPPKDPTPPPPPKDNNDDDDDDDTKRTYHLMGPPTGYEPVKYEPPKDPTPEPPKDPTPEPPKDPTPPPKDPTPPPRDPTPPPPPPPAPANDENANQVQEGEGDTNVDLKPDAPPPPPPTVEQSQNHLDHNEDKKPEQNRHTQQQGTNEGYNKSDSGIFEKSHEFRRNPVPLDDEYSREPNSSPYTDPDFGPSVAIKGENVEWKRPTEFRPDAVLFSSGATRFDIGQGSAGTCWFLSTVAMLADNPDLFHRVVPKDAWNKEGGYFFCYFWRYGEWEKIIIDDTLPVVHGNVCWGAKSRDDDNEMWPALLEKAFARFHGNYNSVYGGQSGDAYLALTGGCSEYIDFDKGIDDNGAKAKALHKRLKNAVKSGSLICTEVPSEWDNHQGLVGGHAYSLSGATQVVNSSGQPVYLVRVRNPWGHTEWTGRWQDNGPEWNSLPKGQISHDKKDDGEFYMELQDFVKYFSGVTICSMTPDFDQDGCEDIINVCTTLFGNWEGETAAGFQNRINNPKYIFTVDDEGMDSDGYIPLVIQICQKLEHRKKNKASIRVDLYKVLAEKSDTGVYVMELLGEETNVYKKERQMSIRHKVEPGQYVVVPSTIDPGMEKDFLVRIFSPSALSDVREVQRQCNVMSSEQYTVPVEISNQGVDTKIRFMDCKISAWKAGKNAGGQVSQPKFQDNPQIEFEIPDRGPQMVDMTLMQSSKVSGFPIGLRLFEMEMGHDIAASGPEGHRQYLYDHYQDCPKTYDNQDGAFILGASCHVTYVLQPGKRYVALMHMDAMDQENDFAICIRSTCALNLRTHCFE